MFLQEDPGPGRYTLRRDRSNSAPPTPRGRGFYSSTTRQTQAHLKKQVFMYIHSDLDINGCPYILSEVFLLKVLTCMQELFLGEEKVVSEVSSFP